MSEPRIPIFPFRVYTVAQPGDQKDEWVGQAPNADAAITIMNAYYISRQNANLETGFVVAVWDETSPPGEVIAFIGKYGTGQYPALLPAEGA